MLTISAGPGMTHFRQPCHDSNLSVNPVYSSIVVVDVQSSVYNYCTWQDHKTHLRDEGSLVVEVSLDVDARGQARGQCVRSRNG